MGVYVSQAPDEKKKIKVLETILPADIIEDGKNVKKFQSSAYIDERYRKRYKELCETFMSTDRSSDTNTYGYVMCCDVCDYCGGIATWIIVLIVIVILGCFAAGGTVFYFLYWKRKKGGRDGGEVEESEDTSKSEHGIIVD
ncbi:hypothetical protein B9Z55_007797 [Caenorhabditis nigoni]|nr:hypothetical protein B9Z55_007797 [Caenorhabditis nigoni]